MKILNKNPNYKSYFNKDLIINKFIFAEFCYQLIKLGFKNVHNILNEVAPGIIKLNLKTIKKAMEFRHKNKNKKISMTYCGIATEEEMLPIRILEMIAQSIAIIIA